MLVMVAWIALQKLYMYNERGIRKDAAGHDGPCVSLPLLIHAPNPGRILGRANVAIAHARHDDQVLLCSPMLLEARCGTVDLSSSLRDETTFQPRSLRSSF